MKVIVKYIYIKRAGTAPAAGGASGGVSAAPARQAAMTRTFNGLVAAETSEEKKRKLKKLQQLLNEVHGKSQNIKGKGVGTGVSAKIDSIMAMAKTGDLDGALGAAESLKTQVDEAVKEGERAAGAMSRLNAMKGGLAPKGGEAVAAMLRAADKALASSTTAEGKAAIAGMLEKGEALAKSLKGMDPSSAGHASDVQELARLTALLDAHVDAAPEEANEARKLAQDGLNLSFKASAEALEAMRHAERDSLKQARIGAIETAMADAHAKASELPTEGMKQLVEHLSKQILLDTAAGKLDEAHEGARQLTSVVDRMTKMDRFLNIKQARADRLAGELKGPAADTMASVMKAIAASRDQATSPDDMHALDAALLEAAQLAEKIQQNPRSLEGLQAHKALKALEKKINSGLKPAAPGAQAHTKALGAAKTAPLHQMPAQGKHDQWKASEGYRQTHPLQALPRLSEHDLEHITALIHQATNGQQPGANGPGPQKGAQR